MNLLIEPPSAEAIARELARRLRAGQVDAATIEAAAGALDRKRAVMESLTAFRRAGACGKRV